MPEPTGWESFLPLCSIADVRGRFITPETLLSVKGGSDVPIGTTVTGNVFTTGIQHNLTDWDAVQFQTTGVLPAPLLANRLYYVRDTDTDTFSAATVIGGPVLTITTGGTGQLTVQNWSLNDLLEMKGAIADKWLYYDLLEMVLDKVKSMPLNAWYAYFPVEGYGPLPNTTPLAKAKIVLDNLTNADILSDVAIDYRAAAMAEDGESRNQITDASMMEDRRTGSISARKKKEALINLKQISSFLLVGTANGANGIFSFEWTNDSVRVSLL